MSCGEDRIRLTAEGRLCDAEEEAREKYRAWEPRVFPLTYREGCGLVELERVTVGVSTKDGEKYSYWYVRRDYETGGKCADRYEALTLIGDELAGCSCRGIVNALCPVHGYHEFCAVEGCDRPGPYRAGMCNAHYLRNYRYGDPLATKPRPSAEERFWRKVNKNGPVPDYAPELGPCWLWTAYTNADGYGEFKWNNRATRAHRISYELLVEEIPEGLHLDHLCRTTNCVNPDHLEPVTMQENILRSPLAHQNRTCCPQGHAYDATTPEGHRYCKTCHRERSNARYHRMRSNPLDPETGDFRDTSVDLWREERDHLDALLGVLEVGL